MFKEGSEPDVYRDNLAEEIKEASKDERHEILDKEKETPEYQISRNKKIEARQNEEEINESEGVFIKKKTLYHGTATKGIKEFERAEETTVGDGVYLTSKAKNAIEYARTRIKGPRGSKKQEADGNPVVYETSVENLKLLDLRKKENFKKIMQGFSKFLWQRAKELKIKIENGEVPESEIRGVNGYRNMIFDAVDEIGNDNVKNICDIQKATGRLGDAFADYVKSVGYDGLIAVEGGEGEYMGSNHDSYVIFDPEKVKIIREQKIKKEK
jgi:hypothetical protein